MNQESKWTGMNPELKNRIKAALWYLGDIAVIAILNEIPKMIVDWSLPPWAVVVIGVICAQVTKYLNRQYQLKKAE